ncbi:hypothetical protein VTK26DRAFT_8773 [Humicola hyalothermophila]
MFPLTAEQIEEGVKAFIDSIDPNDVCRLASQHNSSKTCRMFRDPAHGSYNVCYFVEFEDGNQMGCENSPGALHLQCLGQSPERSCYDPLPPSEDHDTRTLCPRLRPWWDRG